ncbi:unnamed protein product [Diamesa hyperborea]
MSKVSYLFGTEMENIWKSFEKSGKTEFFKQIKSVLKDEESVLLSNDDTELEITRAIYDLIQVGIKGGLKKDSVLSTLADLTYMHRDIASIIMDIFCVLDAETTSQTEYTTEERSLFCSIVKESEKIFSEKLLKERLEIDTLQDVGIVKNKNFYTKFIKIKTKLYYKQRRFNLFREENEGYAKLMTELNKDFSEEVDEVNSLEMVKSLIGCFNLDPNRVLDVILESFEIRPERHELFIPLLKSYMSDSNIISEVLGYKYCNLSDGETPFSLYKVTALILQNDIIQLDDIYYWLTPLDDTLVQDWESEIADAKEFVRKLNIISTNKDKEPEEKEPEVDNSHEKYKSNQKFGLCEALLSIGDWETARKLIEKLPEQCATVHEPLARALCNLIHIVIEPVYRVKCAIPTNIRGKIISPHPNKKSPSQVTKFVDLRKHAFPMLNTLGPSLHYDPVLLQKLLRITRTILTEMNVDSLSPPPVATATIQQADIALYYDIISLLESCILPALSYMECNCCVAEEIWSVMKYYPYNIRYALYSKWKNESYLSHPKLIRLRGDAEKNIKALMKRVSKENVKPIGRRIGKLSHCSPGFLFDYILAQIQLYDNLIGPVVDALKFLTSLSYDVLGYCLVEALASTGRDRFKYNGTSLSDWLQSLANFCGAIYKKYNIELSGLLQYVGNQLKAQKSLDLLILKEIVQKMAGIEAAEEMTGEQLNAMCGGELLRGEAGYFSQVRNTKKSSQRLKEALASNDLSVALCLLIAQQKHCVIYRETSNSHLKLVGKLYDQCQDTLVQFGTFLGSTYSVEEYVERLPTIHSMLQEYHIHSDVAFFLARPMFAHAINQKYDQLRKSDSNFKKLTSLQKQEKHLEATAFVMQPVIESVRPLHPAKIWEDITPQFLVTFWSLSMYDLQVPTESYQKEINKLKQQSAALTGNDSGSNSNNSKIKKEQERFAALIEKLQEEKKKQQEHVEKIMARLNSEKDSWFLSRSAKSAKNETITQFLQLCLFPRCSFTALDAVYCAKFVNTIHSLRTPNFSTLLCYDKIFCDITCCVTSCTENEATRYGRFLSAMLESVMRWHADQATFNKECANYPGFVTKYRVSNQCSEANDHVGYENYRHVCHKWHYKITKAVVVCLDSKDYMRIRNAFIILMRIQAQFPVLTKLAGIIEKKVEKVREDEKNKRQDLFVLASSYIAILKSKSSQLMTESSFHQVSEKVSKEEKAALNGGDSGKAKVTDRKDGKDRERSEKKIIKMTTERESAKKETPVRESTREPPRASREPTREKSTKKEVKHDKEVRAEPDSNRKREVKEKDVKRRDKRPSPVTVQLEERFYEEPRQRELSSVSNSSNGSIHQRSQEPAVIEIDQRASSSDVKKERSTKNKEKREKQTDEEKEMRKERKLGRKRDREEALQVTRRKDDEKIIKISHQNGDEDRHHARENSRGDHRERSHDRTEARHFPKSRTTRSNY